MVADLWLVARRVCSNASGLPLGALGRSLDGTCEPLGAVLDNFGMLGACFLHALEALWVSLRVFGVHGVHVAAFKF